MTLAAPTILRSPSPTTRDALLAIAVALILTAGWLVTGWKDLRLLWLPDTDDMVRLAQIRDWLGGQAFADLRQYRIAPPDGSPMHWSRLGDMGVAGLIAVASVVVNRAEAELFAVIAYPALLFVAYLWLSGRIARRVWSIDAAPVAIILAAIAAPATALFEPGRIDHHGLQIITVQCAVLFLVHPPTVRSGAALGAVAAISLGIGLETAPQIAVLIAIASLLWVIDANAERHRMLGFGIGISAVTALLLVSARPMFWSTVYCDGFSPASTGIAIAIGAATILLSLATSQLTTRWRRLAAGSVLAALLFIFALAAYPACARGPYGSVSPFLIDNYISLISEAKRLFDLRPWPSIIANGGLMMVAAIAAAWALIRFPTRWRCLSPVAGVILVSAAVSLVQLRGIYIGVPLSPALMAGIVLHARRARRFKLAAILLVWVISSGIVFGLVASMIERFRDGKRPNPDAQMHYCEQAGSWRQIDRYAPGVVLTSTNHAAYLIGATRHATVGASYHRNDDANMATYRFFLGPLDQSRRIARQWRAEYVLYCPGDFTEANLTHRYPNGIAAMLDRGQTPPGFQQLPLRDTRFRLYRITP